MGESPSSSQEPGLVELDQTSVARDSQLPVRGTVASSKEFELNDSSKKKHKFYSEMKTTHKLEKSRQSARECRARKKLRYQYLDDLILERERANERLRGEMSKFVGWCAMIDQNSVPETVVEALNNGALEPEQGQQS